MKYLLFYRQSYNVYDDDDEMGRGASERKKIEKSSIYFVVNVSINQSS